MANHRVDILLYIAVSGYRRELREYHCLGLLVGLAWVVQQAVVWAAVVVVEWVDLTEDYKDLLVELVDQHLVICSQVGSSESAHNLELYRSFVYREDVILSLLLNILVLDAR